MPNGQYRCIFLNGLVPARPGKTNPAGPSGIPEVAHRRDLLGPRPEPTIINCQYSRSWRCLGRWFPPVARFPTPPFPWLCHLGCCTEYCFPVFPPTTFLSID